MYLVLSVKENRIYGGRKIGAYEFIIAAPPGMVVITVPVAKADVDLAANVCLFMGNSVGGDWAGGSFELRWAGSLAGYDYDHLLFEPGVAGCIFMVAAESTLVYGI